MKRLRVTTSIGAVGVFTLLLLPLQGCTNLDEVPKSTITPGTFFRTRGEVLAGLAGVYAQLRGAFPGYCCAYYALSEISTDEMVVPTRGQDWYDNGRWLEIHRQNWTPTSPSGLSDINSAWVNDFSGIAAANIVLGALEGRTVMDSAEQAGVVAELRALRAFYYYQLMDLFGGVPIVTTPEIKPRARNTRAEVFQFIESELLAVRPAVPLKWDDADRGRVARGAVDAILANMYLNAGVFTKDTAGAAASQINPIGYNSCSGVQVSGSLDACVAAVNRADSIINSGVYQLADTFVKNFRADNYASPENIFVVKFINQDGLGFPLLMTTLHYYQFTPGPWNGFSTLAQTYNAFDSLDQRRRIFLVGPQVNLETGVPICFRPGCDKGAPLLVFTPTIANVTAASEGEGARIYKWPYDPKHISQNNGNDFAYFRLAEIYLIKAEAELDGAPGAPSPLALLQAVRARAFTGADTLSAVTPDVILRERLFELTFETKRRQDLIRFGQYTQPWQFKAAGADHLVLMPIPQTQIDANPLLAQNPEY